VPESGPSIGSTNYSLRYHVVFSTKERRPEIPWKLIAACVIVYALLNETRHQRRSSKNRTAGLSA
jgi:hypothetical protein